MQFNSAVHIDQQSVRPLFGHSMNHTSQDPSFRGAPAMGRAVGTHLMVTHSSLDHRGQTLCTCYWPLRPCNGAFSGWVRHQFAEACSNGSAGAVWDVIGGWPWRGCWHFGEKSEINTELLMLVPFIDLDSISQLWLPLLFSLSVCLTDGRAWKSV